MGRNIPRYAVTSHRWTDEEVTLKDVIKERNKETAGWQKLSGLCEFMRRVLPSIPWLWMDTCCIDQKSSLEVQECINSMFQWYSEAELCVAYLADVQIVSEDVAWSTESFRRSVWWSRGWTLQELLAPRTVLFLDRTGMIIGYKGDTPRQTAIVRVAADLNMLASYATGIPVGVLLDYNQSKSLTVEERMKWMDNRRTTRAEDMAYSLLGIFDVYMALIYGEGIEEARARLMEAIEIRQKRRTGAGVDVPMTNYLDEPVIAELPEQTFQAEKAAPVHMKGVLHQQSNANNTSWSTKSPVFASNTGSDLSNAGGLFNKNVEPYSKNAHISSNTGSLAKKNVKLLQQQWQPG